jgi:hypothetical protein
MNRRSLASKLLTRAGSAVLCLCLLVAWGGASAQELRGEAGVEKSNAKPHAQRHAPKNSLEDRVKLLTKELDLDAKQQAELRKLLEGQRDQVKKVWDDTSLPAANRVGATQAISDRTGDAIRSMLNEEQKKKYNSAKPPRDATEGSPRPDVEYWMNPAKAKPGGQ